MVESGQWFWSQSLVNEGRFPHLILGEIRGQGAPYLLSQSLVNEGRFPLVMYVYSHLGRV